MDAVWNKSMKYEVWNMMYNVQSIVYVVCSMKYTVEYRVGWLVIVGHRLMFDDFFYKSEKIEILWPAKFYMELNLFSILQYKTFYINGMILER